MTEQVPDPEEVEIDEDEEGLPDPSLIPRWIPTLIGAVLVAMAVLAVYTGLRYRDDNSLARHVAHPERRGVATAPSGEPGAGESLVLPGRDGETTPAANEPVTGRARAEISGGPGGVRAVVRMWARRGMVLNVLPDDAMVYVNDLPIGQVRQFNTMDEVYDFAEPGSYTVRIVAPGLPEKMFVVTADENAKDDVARISAKLEKQR